jgi:hypothetical protein
MIVPPIDFIAFDKSWRNEIPFFLVAASSETKSISAVMPML